MKEGTWDEKDGKLPEGIEFLEPELVERLRQNGHTIRLLAPKDVVLHACAAGEVASATGEPVMADMAVDDDYYCNEHAYKAMRLLDAAEKKAKGQFRQKPKPSGLWDPKN